MKWLNSLVVVAALVLGGFGAWNAKEITAAPASSGVVSSEGAKYVGGPIGSAIGLLVTWFGGKKIAPAAFGGLGKFVLDAIADRLSKPAAPKLASSGSEPTVDATRIIVTKPDIDLSIVLTGEAAKDAVGLQKIGAVLEHFGSGGQAKA